MSKENKYLQINIEFNIKKDTFEIESNIKKEMQSELITTFLRTQLGMGEDKTKANDKELYHFIIKWFPHCDKFEVQDDVNNKGARDGMLYHILAKL